LDNSQRAVHMLNNMLFVILQLRTQRQYVNLRSFRETRAFSAFHQQHIHGNLNKHL